MNVGTIDLGLDINRQGFNRQLSGIASGAQSSVQKAFAPMGKLIGGALAIGALVVFGKSCIDLGSDLAEVQNVVDVTFGSMAGEVNKFASTAITSFGLSETSAKRYTSTMGAMLKSMQIPTKQALVMSKNITGLSADMASFYNLKSQDSFDKIRAGISGETEPLKQLGINMSVANMEAYAMSQGIAKAYAKMSQSEQTLLRYNYLLSVTADAQGDFARTSGGWANQTRILSEQFNALKSTLGQAFINLLTPAVTWLNVLIQKLQVVAAYFKAFTDAVFGAQSQKSGGGVVKVVEDMGGIGTAADDASSAIGGMGDSTVKAAKKAKGALAGFDEINSLSLSKDEGSGGSGAAGAGGGLGEIPEVDLGLQDTSQMVDLFNKSLQPTIDALKRLSKAMQPFKEFLWQGLKDFYNLCLKPIGEWVLGQGLPRFLDAISKGLETINWERINSALRELFEALTPFNLTIGEGLLQFWEKVLVPLAAWTISEILPRFLTNLATAIRIATEVIKGILGVAGQFFDEFLTPIAQYAEPKILAYFDSFTTKFKELAKQIQDSTAFKDLQSILAGVYKALLPVAKALVGIGIWFVDFQMSKAFIDLKYMLKDIEDALGLVADLLNGDFSGAWEHFKDLMLDNKIDKAKEKLQLLQDSFGKLKTVVSEFVVAWAKNITDMFKIWTDKISAWWTKDVAPWFTVEQWNTILFNIGVSLGLAIASFVKMWTVQIPLWWTNNVAPWFTVARWASVAVGMALGLAKKWSDVVTWWNTSLTTWWETKVKTWFTVARWQGLGTNIKTGLVNGFKGAVNSISGLLNNILSNFEGLINKVVTGINEIIEGYNSVTLGRGVDKLSSVRLGRIPMLARGGIVDQPTLAMVGESGKEAVVPLENNTEWVSKVAALIANALLPIIGGGSSSGENKEVVLEIDGTVLGRVLLSPMQREAKRLGLKFE